MLEDAFQAVYTKFKLHFYQKVFHRFATREATLTTVESFCMEGIMALGEPTIAEFSRMMQISTPNAAYKIGSLVRKGYVEKIQSTTDRREYHLRPTQKYIDYYSISYSYLHTVIERVRERFSPEDVAKMEEMLTIINDELMPELQLPATKAAAPIRQARRWGVQNSLILQQYGTEGRKRHFRQLGSRSRGNLFVRITQSLPYGNGNVPHPGFHQLAAKLCHPILPANQGKYPPVSPQNGSHSQHAAMGADRYHIFVGLSQPGAKIGQRTDSRQNFYLAVL